MRVSLFGRSLLLAGAISGIGGGVFAPTLEAAGRGRGGCCEPYCPPSCATSAEPGAPTPAAPGEPEAPMADPDLAIGRFAALGGSDIALAGNTGYIDSSFISTQLRLRFDAAYNFENSDRAGFWYSTWQAFGGELPNPNDPVNPGAPDPDVDFQSFSAYVEYALGSQLSVFVEMPVLFESFSDPLNEETSGVGDTVAGFKYLAFEGEYSQLTLQLKNYLPTGDADRWLGIGHYAIEPGLLYYQALSERLSLEAELRDWIPIDGAVNPLNGENYTGNVLRYGAGLAYDMCESCSGWTVTPVVELVGWTCLDGQVFDFNVGAPVDASGDTIVNLKLGARVTNCAGGSFYAGYGTALTDDAWYQDILRVEYRRSF